MTKYESTIKSNPAPVERVYAKLSDLTNLQVIQERMSDPNFVEAAKAQFGDKVNPDQLEMIQQRVKEMTFERDSVTTHIDQLGADLTLHIIEREEPKLVKMELLGSPVAANLWVQLLPGNDGGTRMKLTIGADLNFFIKQMVGKKLKEGVERFADMLAMLPY